MAIAAQKIIISMMTFADSTPASVVVSLPEIHCCRGRKIAYLAALTPMLATRSDVMVIGHDACADWRRRTNHHRTGRKIRHVYQSNSRAIARREYGGCALPSYPNDAMV